MTSANPTTDRRWYRFGPYVVDAPKRLLWREHTLVPLTAKAFEILLVLIQTRHRVVEKQELLEAVWPRTAVEENTLTRHISTLRKAPDERPDHHEYVLTVPGHGYQFVAEVVELDARPDDLLHSVAPESSERNGHTEDSASDGVVSRMPPSPVPVNADAAVRVEAQQRPAWHVPLAAAGLLSVTGVIAILVFGLSRGSRVESGPQRAVRQFTFESGLQTDPAWSPDGRRVAFASDRAGNSDIWVQALDDPTAVQVTSWADQESQPSWSPDGRQLVFRSERDGGGLFLVEASGGTPRRLTTFGYCPRWSPDGGQILFSSSGHLGGTPRFHVVDLEGGSPRPLRPDLLTDFAPLYAAWRADGKSFSIWGRHARAGWTFLTAGVQGGAPITSVIAPEIARRQLDNALSLGRFAWSASGRHVYFEARAHETQSLWRITVDPKTLAWTDGPERLTTGTTQDEDAALSPDGGLLVFSAKSVRTRLWMFPFDAASGRLTGAGQPVTTGGSGEQDADLPDDGSKLVYRTRRGGTQQLWERSVADGRERLLVRGDQWTRTRPRWSADGSRLSYLRRPRNANGQSADGSVVVLAVDRGEERVLTRPDGPQLIPSDWSADGRWVLGGCPQPATRRVGTCLVDTLEGNGPPTVRLLTADATHNTFEPRFSPDQRWISFIAVNGADAGVSTVFVMPASGGRWQAITDGTTYDDKPHWAPDGRTVYFVSHRDGILNVWGRRFDTNAGVGSGPIFKVTSFEGPRQMISQHLSEMQIALTGNRLFLPITETRSDLWILENVDR